MKRIGFLSFGHWSDSPYSEVRSASDALLQSVELAVAAEELGADGAYFRVHHFAQQLGSPFPLLAAVGARTNRIEMGTAVVDMRYENPFYMAEDAGAADLIAGGRLQLGISRGSPEQVIDGFRHFGGRCFDTRNCHFRGLFGDASETFAAEWVIVDGISIRTVLTGSSDIFALFSEHIDPPEMD